MAGSDHPIRRRRPREASRRMSAALAARCCRRAHPARPEAADDAARGIQSRGVPAGDRARHELRDSRSQRLKSAMPRVLHILDSVAAARDLLARSANVGDLELLSTHYSVVSYLGERGIACRDCTDFLSVDAAGAALREASSELDERLA